MRPYSSMSRRWRHRTHAIVRSDRWSHRTKVVVWSVLFAVIALEGALIIQPSESSQNETGSHLPIRAAPAASAPVSAVLPPASPATTLVPATAAEQAAFKAGQRSCQSSPATNTHPASAAEQAAFKAGSQWCHPSTTVGHDGSGNKQ